MHEAVNYKVTTMSLFNTFKEQSIFGPRTHHYLPQLRGLEGRNTFLDVTQQGHKMSVFFYQHHMTYIIYICWCVTWLPLPLPLTWFNPSIRARGWWRTPAWETEAFCSRACDCLLSPDGNIPEEPGWHCLLSPRRPQPSLVDGINLESWLTSLRYAQSPGRQNTLS